DVGELLAAPQRVARLVLARDLLEGAAHDFLLRLAGNDDDAVDVAEDEVARMHADAAAYHRHVALDHARAALGVERADAAAEHRKAHLADLPDVAHQAVGDASGCAARPARGREQLTPRR